MIVLELRQLNNICSPLRFDSASNTSMTQDMNSYSFPFSQNNVAIHSACLCREMKGLFASNASAGHVACRLTDQCVDETCPGQTGSCGDLFHSIPSCTATSWQKPLKRWEVRCWDSLTLALHTSERQGNDAQTFETKIYEDEKRGNISSGVVYKPWYAHYMWIRMSKPNKCMFVACLEECMWRKNPLFLASVVTAKIAWGKVILPVFLQYCWSQGINRRE